MSKYNSNKITLDGISFDSKVEGKYYEYLKQLKAQGKIINFELQPRYQLIPKFTYHGETRRKTEYVADFLIYHLDGTEEVVDIKGMPTETAKLKKKMFEFIYQDKKLSWICQSFKYGDEYGWIDQAELTRKRRGAKK